METRLALFANPSLFLAAAHATIIMAAAPGWGCLISPSLSLSLSPSLSLSLSHSLSLSTRLPYPKDGSAVADIGDMQVPMADVREGGARAG